MNLSSNAAGMSINFDLTVSSQKFEAKSIQILSNEIQNNSLVLNILLEDLDLVKFGKEGIYSIVLNIAYPLENLIEDLLYGTFKITRSNVFNLQVNENILEEDLLFVKNLFLGSNIFQTFDVLFTSEVELN